VGQPTTLDLQSEFGDHRARQYLPEFVGCQASLRSTSTYSIHVSLGPGAQSRAWAHASTWRMTCHMNGTLAWV
jgi:hypothetical protein